MLKQTITYVDYDDQERTETFYFNLTEAEIAILEVSTRGGLSQKLQYFVDQETKEPGSAAPEIVEFLDMFIRKAYGVKSEDGRRFIKNSQLSQEFTETPAYSQLFLKLATDGEAASAFVNALIVKQKSA